ncbi:FimV/HubP family polar landmark protein [Psychrobacter sp. FDAARGOS_221]|uniref:FimV/HubP family polar landmark protein n=1 Tax=Psychrobacter sp. FDAARGOS_221 TaxID=1975705 RepID=UPI000BB52E83|nr:FimV/HubP family polar landmark protein [Psychrobacter sp. FDAARGOS_221]PNK61239.1 hypothetical protein A6J60_010380 [Psychrobacter sp. FDAARGOS_221]
MSLRIIVALVFIALLLVLLFIVYRSQATPKRPALKSGQQPDPADNTSAKRKTLYDSSLSDNKDSANQDAQTQTNTQSSSQTKAQQPVAPKPEPKTELKTESKSEAKPESKPESKPEPQQQPKPVVEQEKKSAAKSETPVKADGSVEPVESENPVKPNTSAAEKNTPASTAIYRPLQRSTNKTASSTTKEQQPIAPAADKAVDSDKPNLAENKKVAAPADKMDAPLLDEAEVEDILGKTSSTPATVPVPSPAATNTVATHTADNSPVNNKPAEKTTTAKSNTTVIKPATEMTVNKASVQQTTAQAKTVDKAAATTQPSEPNKQTPSKSATIKIQGHDERQATATQKEQAKASTQTEAESKPEAKTKPHAQLQPETQPSTDTGAETKAATPSVSKPIAAASTTVEANTDKDSSPQHSEADVEATDMQAFEFVKDLDSAQLTLDLAQQYLEVGEYDSAKRLLQEVLQTDSLGKQASEQQQSVARALLQRLY